MKKLTQVLFALSIAFVVFAGARYAGAAEVVGSGTNWTLYDDGLLAIEGTGEMTLDWQEYIDFSLVQSVSIADGVTVIGDLAFCGLYNMTEIKFPASLSSIGSEAFLSCSGLTGLILPDAVSKIGDEAFSYCNNLRSIVLSESLATIGSKAFEGCDALTEITVCDNLRNSYTSSFSGCINVTDVTVKHATGGTYAIYAYINRFPNCVSVNISGYTAVGSSYFQDCSSIERITFLDSIFSIGDSTFSSCSSLAGIEFADSLTVIGKDIFDSSTSPLTVVFDGNAPSFYNDTFSGDVIEAYYPEGDSSWTNVIKKSYGGDVTWHSYAEAAGNIYGANLNLGADLKFNFYADLFGNSADVKLKYTDISSNKVKYSDYDKGGFYSVSIAPANIFHEYKIELVDGKGNVINSLIEPFGVATYCETLSQMTEFKDDERSLALLASILNYGIAAEKYLDTVPSVLPDWAKDHLQPFKYAANDLKIDGEGDYGAYIKSATLYITDVINIKFAIDAENQTNLTAALYRTHYGVDELLVNMKSILHLIRLPLMIYMLLICLILTDLSFIVIMI